MLLTIFSAPAPPPSNTPPVLISHYIENRDISFNMPSAVVAGDLILACFSGDNNTDPLPSGWFRVARLHGGGDGQTLGVIGKIALGTESSTTVTVGSSDYTWLIYQYRGVDPANPIGLSVSTNSNSGASGQVTPDVSLTVPAVTTTVLNSTVFALFGGDVLAYGEIWTYTTPSGFGNKLQNTEAYDTLCAFDKVQEAIGSSGDVTCAMNTNGILGLVFVINPPLGGSGTNVRALVLVSGVIQQITDAQIGTGLKPLVRYTGEIVQRAASEGVPLIYDAGTLREIVSGETLLI